MRGLPRESVKTIGLLESALSSLSRDTAASMSGNSTNPHKYAYDNKIEQELCQTRERLRLLEEMVKLQRVLVKENGEVE